MSSVFALFEQAMGFSKPQQLGKSCSSIPFLLIWLPRFNHSIVAAIVSVVAAACGRHVGLLIGIRNNKTK